MDTEYNQFVTAMKCEVADTPKDVVMNVCVGEFGWSESINHYR